VSRQQWQEAQLGSGQGRCPGSVGATPLGKLGSQRLRLADQSPEVGPVLENLIDLSKGLTGAVSSSAYLYSPWADSLGKAG
jgi:hypothetical protein